LLICRAGDQSGATAIRRAASPGFRTECRTGRKSRPDGVQNRGRNVISMPERRGYRSPVRALGGSLVRIDSKTGFWKVMTIRLHRGDLPDLSRYTSSVAIDTETMGLHPHRDRLCVVQMSNGDGTADVVQIPKDHTDAPNLKALLANPKIMKIFHFARFDLAALYNAFGVMPQPVYCTKIASRLTRTYTDRHGLKDLVREVLNIDLSKQQQSSDWGSQALSEAQLSYAASDVLHLHALRERLDLMLAREGRTDLAQACFGFLPTRAKLDLDGWDTEDIFAHS
jgi:ribonuclease D